MTPTYEARALLIIEPDLGGRGGATVATSSQTPDSAVGRQPGPDPGLPLAGARDADGPRARGRSRADRVGRAGTGLLARSAAAAGRRRPQPRPVDPVGEFLDRLSVKREGKSHVIALAWRSRDAGEGGRGREQAGRALHGRPARRKDAASRRQSGRFDEQLAALKGRVDCGRGGAGRLSGAERGGARRQPGRGPGRDRRPRRPAGRGHGRARRPRADCSSACASWSRAATRPCAMGELGGSPMLDNLLALKAELLAARGRARRPVRRAPPQDPGHPGREGEARRGASAQERKGVLRQYEGEVARARAGERILAGKLAELKGRALRREADAGRTARAGARGRAQPPPVRSLPRARQCRGAARCRPGRPTRG